MDLYRRPNSLYWWYWFRIDGKLMRGSTKRPLTDKKGAQRFLAAEYERRMNTRQFGEKPETTLGEAFDRIVGMVKGSTATQYALNKRTTCGLDVFAQRKGHYSIPADTLLSQIRDEHVEDLVSSRQKAGYTSNSINGELRGLKRALNVAKRRYAVNNDLTIKMLKGFEKTRFLSRDEEAAILRVLLAQTGSPAYDKARDLFIFLIDTGFRLNEGLDITWAEVNATVHRIEVFRTKTHSMSMVPMSGRVAEMLDRKRNQKVPFANMTRAVRVLRKVINEVCNGDPRVNAQRGKATIHCLRDTFASRLASGGMSLHKVSKLLGHTSVTMTRKYAHLESQDVAEEARRLLGC